MSDLRPNQRLKLNGWGSTNNLKTDHTYTHLPFGPVFFNSKHSCTRSLTPPPSLECYTLLSDSVFGESGLGRLPHHNRDLYCSYACYNKQFSSTAPIKYLLVYLSIFLTFRSVPTAKSLLQISNSLSLFSLSISLSDGLFFFFPVSLILYSILSHSSKEGRTRERMERRKKQKSREIKKEREKEREYGNPDGWQRTKCNQR